MLISHRKKFIYTKTARSAGTSVEVYFEPFCLPENTWKFSHSREEFIGDTGIIGYRGNDRDEEKWFNHMPAKQIKEHLGNKVWSQYYKFCVIRNPFDKLVSLFHFNESAKKKRAKVNQIDPKIIWEKKSKSVVARFREWILDGQLFRDHELYMIDGEFCLDFYIKYEELENGMRHVCDVLKIPFNSQKIPKLKVGNRPVGAQLNHYYDSKTIEVVNNLYQREIEKFDYSAPAGRY
jgi:hypothetical protein